jgi:DNA-binding MarR family transcriptional regulator
VKLLDQRIEGSFEAALASEGLVRRHWQVLNVVKDGPVTSARIDEELAPFLADASPFVRDLVERGWVAISDDGCELTKTGREAYERLLQTVQASRARIADGLTEEQYRTTVDVLERMCANLVLPCATSSSPPTRSGSASS